MSARKADTASSAANVAIPTRQTHLTLLRDAVWVRKDGIEFRSDKAFPLWTEMTVTLESPRDSGTATCNGVVVGCSGNRHIGYVVTMVFTGLSPQSLERLNHFVQPPV